MASSWTAPPPIPAIYKITKFSRRKRKDDLRRREEKSFTYKARDGQFDHISSYPTEKCTNGSRE